MLRFASALLATLALGAPATQQPRVTTLADLGRHSEEGWVAPSPQGGGAIFVAVDSAAYLWMPGSRALRQVGRGEFSHPMWSPAGGRLAFDRDQGDSTWVFVLGVDDRTGALRGEPRRIAAGDTPKFSPDGRCLAIGRDVDGGRALIVMLADGSSEAEIARNRDGIAPIGWSADGRWVYYCTFDPRGRGSRPILRVSATGGEPEPVLARNVMRSASLSPDGRYLLIKPNPDTLAVVDTAGRTVMTVGVDNPDAGLRTGAPAWDGASIVFATLRRTRGLVAVSLDDGARRVLSDSGTRSVFPDVSPDGRFVATLTNDGGRSFVRVTSLQDGSSRRLATRAETTEGEIRWSPDGAWVAVLTGGVDLGGVHSSATGLDLVEVATGRVEQPPTRDAVIRVKWRPDGRALRYLWQPPGPSGSRRVEVRETRIGGPDSLVLAFNDDGGAVFADYDHAYSLDRGLFYDLRSGTSRRLIDSTKVTRPLAGQPWGEPKSSPDGRWLAVPARVAAKRDYDRIMLVSVADGSFRHLNPGPVSFSGGGGLQWLDAGTIIATGRDADGVWRLRLIPLDGSAERRIAPTDPERATIYYGVDAPGRRLLVSSPDSLGPAALMRIEPWPK